MEMIKLIFAVHSDFFHAFFKKAVRIVNEVKKENSNDESYICKGGYRELSKLTKGKYELETYYYRVVGIVSKEVYEKLLEFVDYIFDELDIINLNDLENRDKRVYELDVTPEHYLDDFISTCDHFCYLYRELTNQYDYYEAEDGEEFKVENEVCVFSKNELEELRKNYTSYDDIYKLREYFSLKKKKMLEGKLKKLYDECGIMIR